MTKRTMLENPFALDLGFLDQHLSTSRLNPIFIYFFFSYISAALPSSFDPRRRPSRLGQVRFIVEKNSGERLVFLEEVVNELEEEGEVGIESSTWNGAESPDAALIASGHGPPLLPTRSLLVLPS
ncbi:hypothetical protein ACFX2I_040634 [Malus domestica]